MMNKKYEKKIVYLLIKIHPGNSEHVHIMLTLFRRLLVSDRLLNITFSSIYGPYDILMKMEGDENILEQTAFLIREELGNCISDTLTLPVLEYTVKADKLKKRFKEAADMIPTALNDFDDNGEIKLDELKQIVDSDGTISNKLLESLKCKAKPMNLNQQIDALTKRIEKLEKSS